MTRPRIGLVLGPVLAGLLTLFGPPVTLVEMMPTAGDARLAWAVLALLILMATWWVSEAIPIPVTALLPMIVLPLAGVSSVAEATSPYMHPVVVLLMGGFIVARAIERWNLHARIALSIVVKAGKHPDRLIAGFMAAAAILSMWISNTATSIMMMPIALSVAAAVLGDDEVDAPFTYALLLGIAWSCSIGGLGTPVGTPTNLIVIGYLAEEAQMRIDFAQWMLIGVPMVALMVPAAWFVLTKWAFKLDRHFQGKGQAVIHERLAALVPLTTPERRTLIVFSVIASMWIFRRPLTEISLFGVTPFGGLTDTVVAIIGVVLCFLVPAGGKAKGEALLDWKTAETIPWGVILLFGGGMSLAAAINGTGLGDWIGEELIGLTNLPILILMALITGIVIFVTEITSNIATASALMPVLGAMATASGIDITLLAMPLAMAASCAFMLPMATGPNAVVFGTGHVSLPTMAGAGLRLNLLGIVLITLAVFAIAPRVFG